MPEFDRQPVEARRLNRQLELDAERTAMERNQQGQFATPPALARDVMRFALGLHPASRINFLEPSCGSGAFYSALLEEVPNNAEIRSAIGIEIDERFASLARELWADTGLEVLSGDFFTAPRPDPSSVSLLIANPPYVRHHHLSAEQKSAYVARCQQELGIKTSGLAGLYIYFVLLSHKLLAPGAVSAWLIPSEFLDTNYGKALRRYLAERVTIKRLHRFDPEGTQFNDAMVTSCVLVFTNTPPSSTNLVEFSQGGTVSEPEERRLYPQSELSPSNKWSNLFSSSQKSRPVDHPRFDEFVKVRRGIATGSNNFFILPRARVEELGIQRGNVVPMLPSPRYLKQDVVLGDELGYPKVERPLAVINPTGSMEQIADSDPALADYLRSVDEKTLSSYLVRQRNPWYRLEKRDPSPFLLTYMGRGSAENERPFRFILNHSEAIATNMYLMLYPVGALAIALETGQVEHESILNAILSISAQELLEGGRVYGGGLRKIEPKELAAMDASVIADLLPDFARTPRAVALF